MPYINKNERPPYLFEPVTAGQLSYAVTRMCVTFRKNYWGSFGYAGYALVAGVLILTLFEFVRRAVNPYEDTKLADNGDVYEKEL